MRSYIIRRAFKLAAVCLAVIALLGLAFLVVWSWLFPMPPRMPDERVEMVDFVGLHVDEVLGNGSFLEKYDFYVVYEETDAYSAGTIIRQRPSAGRMLVEEDVLRRVRLYVATE